MTPYYPLDSTTHHIIAELIATCTKLNLGNVSFSYYRDEVDFYLTENKKGWELTVSQGKHRQVATRDVYRVVGGKIEYRYSESDGGRF